MLMIRPAREADAKDLCVLDQIARDEPSRREFIRRVIAADLCHVALEDGHIRGYLVLEYTFYELGFVSMLYVDQEARGRGVGRALMQHAASICTTPKLFTSTNLSNHPMQALLAALEYRLSGVLHYLDEGDPELVYVKHLQASHDGASKGQEGLEL